MNANSFKAFGVVVIYLHLLGFCASLDGILGHAEFSSSQLLKMRVAFVAIFIVGVGLIGLRKWAAIYFSVPLFCMGLWIFWGSIEHVPFPWNLVFMLEGVSLMLPAVVTVRLWPYLSWREKWFF